MELVYTLGAMTRRSVLGLATTAVSLAALGATAQAENINIALIPKFTSDPYFVAANAGAQEAAEELGVTVEFQGPVNADVSAQADIIDRFVRRRFDVIAVSANDPDALAPALKRAREAGIKTMTWDADVNPDARSLFLNQVTFEGLGKTFADMAVRSAGTEEGEFLIVTAVLTAPNQNRWIQELKAYAATAYPGMTFPAILPGDEDLEKSKNVTLNYLQANPQTKGVIAVTGIATPGVVEAVKQLDMVGTVSVTGLGGSQPDPSLSEGRLIEGGCPLEPQRHRLRCDLHCQGAARRHCCTRRQVDRSRSPWCDGVHLGGYHSSRRAVYLHCR